MLKYFHLLALGFIRNFNFFVFRVHKHTGRVGRDENGWEQTGKPNHFRFHILLWKTGAGAETRRYMGYGDGREPKNLLKYIII